MKKLIIITAIILNFNINAQITVNIKKIFILHFIEEGIFKINNKATGERVYNADLVDIDVDSVLINNSRVELYKFELGKNKIKIDENKFEIGVNMSSCSKYIIGFDYLNQNNYRLQGFKGNDLNVMIYDICESEQVKANTVLKDLSRSNIEIDFKCIYKSLEELDYGNDCLKTCADGKPAHAKINKAKPLR